MKNNICCQKYTRGDVKKLLEFNEGSGKAASPNVKREVVHTVHGPMSITMRTGADSGHTQSRHLLISEAGLEERTLPKGDNDGLELASAFLANKYENLAYCLTGLLNSDKGQLALSYLDMYRDRGKTRIVVSETAQEIGCHHINARVFYQGHDASTNELVTSVTAVIDSNISGELPLRIVTCFPSKEAAGFSIGTPSMLQEARDCTSEFEKALSMPGTWKASGSAELVLADRVLCWMVKSSQNIPVDLVPDVRQFVGKALLLGTRFNDGWFRPNTSLYSYAHPLVKISAEKELLAYQKQGAALPSEKLLNTNVFINALKQRSKSVEYFDDILIHRIP